MTDDQALAAEFPIQVGRVTVVVTRMEKSSGGYRYAQLQILVDGNPVAARRVSVRFDKSVVSAENAARGLALALRMTASVVSPESIATAALAGPLARPDHARDAVLDELVARLRTRHRLPLRTIEWAGLAENDSARVELSGFEDVGDDLVATLTHTVEDTQRSATVVVLPFPDDQDETRVAAYRTALWAVLNVYVALPVEAQAEVSLSDLIQPYLLEDPDLDDWRSIAAAWMVSGPLGGRLGRSVVPQTSTERGPVAQWLRAVVYGGRGVLSAMGVWPLDER